MNIINFRLIRKIFSLLTLIIFLFSACKDDFLETYPEDSLSEAIFWRDKKDATNALTGCYYYATPAWTRGLTGWNTYNLLFDLMTDIARTKFPPGNYGLGIHRNLQTNWWAASVWTYNYQRIASFNYFLENIEKVDMDPTEKAEMIAEVRFLRSYSYFWLSQLHGNVPLVTEVLTFNEANSVSQALKKDVINFALDELKQAAIDLPIKRPSSEKGRVEKGTALAIRGRLLMADNQWSEAAQTYKQIMDLNRYSIDPRFKKLFEDEGDDSDEIIFAVQQLEDHRGESMTQKVTPPSWFGGNNHTTIFQEFVDKFLMMDGKTIEESPLYDPENPFENRDPRLYATVWLPDYSYNEAQGKIFRGHPDSLTMIGQTGPGLTGYAPRKFYDEDYKGDVWNYGSDFILVRYAEVLLSYLESILEAGDGITQSLLDNTINKVRGRQEINMPPVTETNPDKLREIIRRERVVEFGLEGLRYWDLRRWGIALEVIAQDFHGMKLTDNPEEYDGKYIINDKGHLFSCTRDYYEYNDLWAIPQGELDINKNLVQNPGYN